ncbi:DUF397 domain-containing protein [Streptomyces sp. NPDC093109]|uniref:DUF397 domain-containing protein n=1 Tax=Streptomyces sp. NPDC093109 TaxID=3154977 RepID=UPI00344E9E14
MIHKAPSSVTWRTSSFCHPSDSYCVETALLPHRVIGVRDAKDPGGAMLEFSGDAWDNFLTKVKITE